MLTSNATAPMHAEAEESRQGHRKSGQRRRGCAAVGVEIQDGEAANEIQPVRGVIMITLIDTPLA